jgi:hypothetical protein
MTTIDTAADEAGRRDALADRLFRTMIEPAEPARPASPATRCAGRPARLAA